MYTRYLFLILVVSAFIGCQSGKQNEQKNGFESAITESHRLIDSIQRNGHIPGIDVAISIGGEIIWSEGFGFADLEHKAPVIAGKTRFRIGSVSKPLTAAALGKLMDKGLIDVNLPVQAYVPHFPEKRFPLTVKQVAGHIGGIRHYNGTEFLMSKHFNSVKEGLTIFSADSLLFEPGTKYSYSSYGFNLISAVIEGASGEEFIPFIEREVFSALGMTSTCPDLNDSIIVNRTSFYEVNQQGTIVNAPYVDNSYKWAGGGFISTTTDLVKFAEAHLKPGFLTEKTLHELITSQVLNNGEKTGYGLGWFSFKDGEFLGFGHGGGSVGGITTFNIYPKDNLVIVLLSNSSDTRYGNVPGRIVQLFREAIK